jgi:hypothetical protein
VVYYEVLMRWFLTNRFRCTHVLVTCSLVHTYDSRYSEITAPSAALPCTTIWI